MQPKGISMLPEAKMLIAMMVVALGPIVGIVVALS
jgi:hypothetical protein